MKSDSSLSLSTHYLPLLVIISTLTTPSLSSPDTFLYVGCSQLKYSPTSQYEPNLNSLLTSIVNSAMSTSFNKFTISPATPDSVSGLFQCRPDLRTLDCAQCVQRAVTQLGTLCVGSCGGALQLEGCLVKYDNATFLGVEDKSVVLKKCGPGLGAGSDGLTQKEAVLGYLDGGAEFFRVGDSGSAKGMALCTADMSASECQDCLAKAIGRLRSECGEAAWGDMFLGKCYVRYSTAGGYSYNSNSGSSQNEEIEKTLAILIGLIAGVALIIIFLAFLRKLCKERGGK